MDPNTKSSFVRRTLSKEDAIIQVYRQMIGGRVTQALDIFDRLVTEAETLTKLGVKIQVNRETVFATPKDLAANMDEFPELEQIAKQGREFLNKLGYVPRVRATTPITGEGSAPVGKTVDVKPIVVTLPGSEPVTGATVKPKAK